MQNRRNLGLVELAGILLTVLLTFLLQGAFSVPRFMLVLAGMKLLWNQSQSPALIDAVLYVAFDFPFALLAGVLAIGGCHLLLPRAKISVVCVFAAWIDILYGILTIFMQGKLPFPFFPTYLAFAAALPGWLIAYYFAGGAELRRTLNFDGVSNAMAAAVAVVASVVAVPLYFPFYVQASPPSLRVNSYFHPVPPNFASQNDSYNASSGQPGNGYVNSYFHSVPPDSSTYHDGSYVAPGQLK